LNGIALRKQEELAAIVEACPFAPDSAGRHAYVIFGPDGRVLDELAATHEARDEGAVRGDDALYGEAARGSTLGSPFSKMTSKAKYKPYVTTRNVRTVMKLADE
jgi:uncharacterized protein (DUF1697 family)